MSPNTRNVLIGSGSLVAVGLCVGLVAYYSGARGVRHARQELAYVPAAASVVAFADVRAIMDSEFRQKLRGVMRTGAEKDRLFEETGIDLERDIDSAVVGVTAAGTSRNGISLFRGRFDQDRIEAVATANGARREQYGQVAMLVGFAPSSSEHAEQMSGEHEPALAFLDADLLALGDVNGLRAAIDVAAAGHGVSADPELMRLIGTVEGTGDAWLVGRARYLLEQHEGVSGQVRDQLQNVEWLTVNVDVDRGVRGLMRAEARDDNAGQQLRSSLAGLLAMAKIAGQDAVGPEVLNSLQLAGTGRTIELSFELPPGTLDKFATAPHVP